MAYIGPEQWITPTLKPKNGLYRAGAMAHTDSQAQERPITGRKTSAERSANSTDGKGGAELAKGEGSGRISSESEPSPEASEQSAEGNDGRS